MSAANERALMLSDNISGSSETRVTGIIRYILYYKCFFRLNFGFRLAKNQQHFKVLENTMKKEGTILKTLSGF